MINTNFTRLYKNDGKSYGGVYVKALNNTFNLTEKGFHWVPFPILSNNESVNKANINVLPAHNHNENVGIGNLNYYTTGQTPVSPRSGAVVISVEE